MGTAESISGDSITIPLDGGGIFNLISISDAVTFGGGVYRFKSTYDPVIYINGVATSLTPDGDGVYSYTPADGDEITLEFSSSGPLSGFVQIYRYYGDGDCEFPLTEAFSGDDYDCGWEFTDGGIALSPSGGVLSASGSGTMTMACNNLSVEDTQVILSAAMTGAAGDAASITVKGPSDNNVTFYFLPADDQVFDATNIDATGLTSIRLRDYHTELNGGIVGIEVNMELPFSSYQDVEPTTDTGWVLAPGIRYRRTLTFDTASLESAGYTHAAVNFHVGSAVDVQTVYYNGLGTDTSVALSSSWYSDPLPVGDYTSKCETAIFNGTLEVTFDVELTGGTIDNIFLRFSDRDLSSSSNTEWATAGSTEVKTYTFNTAAYEKAGYDTVAIYIQASVSSLVAGSNEIDATFNGSAASWTETITGLTESPQWLYAEFGWASWRAGYDDIFLSSFIATLTNNDPAINGGITIHDIFLRFS